MVRYASKWFEKLINKLVLLSLFVIIIIFFVKESFIGPYQFTIDIIINAIFIIDLGLIFQKRKSFRSFLLHNWLDIIACIPFNLLFRAAKLVKLARLFKVARQGKTISFIPKFARLKVWLWLKGSKAFSKETDVSKHIKETMDNILELKLRKIDREMNRIYKILNS